MRAFAWCVGVLLAARPAGALQEVGSNGPGLGNESYSPVELYRPISSLTAADGAPAAIQHALMHRGYLLLAGEGEAGGAGVLSFWDVSDPRTPRRVGQATAPERSFKGHGYGVDLTHDVLVCNGGSGMHFWNVRDVTRPEFLGRVSAARWSISYQPPYAYGTASGYFNSSGNLDVVDASDPRNPRVVNTVNGPGTVGFPFGAVHAIGNWLIVSGSEANGQAIFDISNPTNPVLLGRITTANEDTYESTVNGYRIFAARGGGWLTIFDIRDPRNPILVRQSNHPDATGEFSYEYVNVKENYVFASTGTALILYDQTTFQEVLRGPAFPNGGEGEVVHPMGNLALFLHDNPGNAAKFVPWTTEPDRTGPSVNMVVPLDGAVNQARTSRVGVTFTDFVDGRTVNASTFIVRPVGGSALTGRYSLSVYGYVNFTPDAPLQADTTYEVVIPSGGIRDLTGNGIVGFTSRFSTGPTLGGPPSDSQPPTPPSNLAVTATTDVSVSLRWGPSSDNVGVAGYRVYRDDVLVGATSETSFTSTGLRPLTSYRFQVVAYDAAGNVSAPSNSVTATTDPSPTPTPSVTITSPADGSTVGPDFMITFTLQNWTLQEGGTHLHWFLNGTDRGPWYTSDPIPATGVASGTHTLTLKLAHADHTLTGVEDSVLITVASSGGGTNLVLNPSFETDADVDGFPDSWWRRPEASADPSTARSGAVSLRVTPGSNYVFQNISLRPGAEYVLSGWIRVEGVSGGSGVWLSFHQLSASGATLGRTPEISGTTGWTFYQVRFVVPSDHQGGRLDLGYEFTAGTAWFDDISLTEAGASPPSPPSDSDGDGLPDSWEMEHFGNLSETAMGDPDSDGRTNLAEYQAGTDPMNPDSDGDGLLDGSDPVPTVPQGGSSGSDRSGRCGALGLEACVVILGASLFGLSPNAFRAMRRPCGSGPKSR